MLLVKESFSLCRIGLSLGTSKYGLELIFIDNEQSYIIDHSLQLCQHDWTRQRRKGLG